MEKQRIQQLWIWHVQFSCLVDPDYFKSQAQCHLGFNFLHHKWRHQASQHIIVRNISHLWSDGGCSNSDAVPAYSAHEWNVHTSKLTTLRHVVLLITVNNKDCVRGILQASVHSRPLGGCASDGIVNHWIRLMGHDIEDQSMDCQRHDGTQPQLPTLGQVARNSSCLGNTRIDSWSNCPQQQEWIERPDRNTTTKPTIMLDMVNDQQCATFFAPRSPAQRLCLQFQSPEAWSRRIVKHAASARRMNIASKSA